jgi:hypothetical protein
MTMADALGFVLCVLSLLVVAAVIVAIFYLIAWAIEQIFGITIPPRVTQLLGVALLLLLVIGLIDCLGGGAHFLPWRVTR